MRFQAGGDTLLVRALCDHESRAPDILFRHHFDALYGLMRMLVPTQAQAAEVATVALARAVEQPERLPAALEGATVAAGSLRAWLIAEAIAELPPLDDVDTGPAEREQPPRRAPKTIGLELLRSVTDDTLRVLVRTLEPGRRRALVVHLLAGCGPTDVARILQLAPPQAERLVNEGIDELRKLLTQHEVREHARGAALSSKAAYHLRPLPGPSSSGIIVVRGTQAFVERGQASSLLRIAHRAIERFIAFLQRRHIEHELHDEVGGPVRRSRAPEPTPTLQPIRKPKRTAGQREYRNPDATPGIASYRIPKGTPSTARLSGRTRPAAAASGIYTARRRQF